MDEAQHRDALLWLAVLRGPAQSPAALWKLAEFAGSPYDLFGDDPGAWRALGLTPGPFPLDGSRDLRGAEADLRWLQGDGRHLIAFTDSRYPALLRAIPDPPAALFVRGEPEALSRTQLAIVGSRTPSPDGRRLAFEFACEVSRAGIAVTSGLATGIDSHAHLGALHGEGVTLAVLGNGADSVYPPGSDALAERIVERGALLSEYPTGTAPHAHHFPRRNRIISGLCVGTLVVEAALRSGSLITARHALDQGREVFAIPGSIRNPMTRGCHALLRQGAKLVEITQDIFEEIGALSALARVSYDPGGPQATAPKPLDEEIKLLLDNIGFQPVHIDCLIEATRLPARIAASRLSAMEIAGLIEALPGGNYARRPVPRNA